MVDTDIGVDDCATVLENFSFNTHVDGCPVIEDSGAKDSGCDEDLDNFDKPNEELIGRLVEQIEFYFSDSNITKDAFLLKHLRRNKEGLVSVKLISSFKRIKHLTKDWRVVAYAIEHFSEKLELNDDKAKVRRLDPLPEFDETIHSRTILATGFQFAKISIESVADFFKDCGEIALIRILRPDNPIPADVKQFIKKNSFFTNDVCALIEFLSSDGARKSLSLAGAKLKIFELKNVIKLEKSMKKNAKKIEKCHCCHVKPLRRGYSDHLPFRPTYDPGEWLQRRFSASSTEAHFNKMAGFGRQYSAPPTNFHKKGSSSMTLSSSNDSNSYYSYYSPSTASMSSSCDSGICGPTSRRTSSGSDNSWPRSRSNSNNISVYHLSDNVIRMPQGPDGTKGFRASQHRILLPQPQYY